MSRWCSQGHIWIVDSRRGAHWPWEGTQRGVQCSQSWVQCARIMSPCRPCCSVLAACRLKALRGALSIITCRVHTIRSHADCVVWHIYSCAQTSTCRAGFAGIASSLAVVHVGVVAVPAVRGGLAVAPRSRSLSHVRDPIRRRSPAAGREVWSGRVVRRTEGRVGGGAGWWASTMHVGLTRDRTAVFSSLFGGRLVNFFSRPFLLYPFESRRVCAVRRCGPTPWHLHGTRQP